MSRWSKTISGYLALFLLPSGPFVHVWKCLCFKSYLLWLCVNVASIIMVFITIYKKKKNEIHVKLDLYFTEENHVVFSTLLIVMVLLYTGYAFWVTFRYCYVELCHSVPVAQWLEHCVSSAKVVGSIPREHTYWLEVCTGSKLKPEPGPYPRLSDPTRPDPSGTVKFRARTRPEIPPPTNSQQKKGCISRLHAKK